MGILSWIIVGLIAGWLAGVVMRSRLGILGDIIVGIIGGVVGGFLAAAVFGVTDAVNGINVYSIVVAFVGAVILLGLLKLVQGRPVV